MERIREEVAVLDEKVSFIEDKEIQLQIEEEEKVKQREINENFVNSG